MSRPPLYSLKRRPLQIPALALLSGLLPLSACTSVSVPVAGRDAPIVTGSIRAPDVRIEARLPESLAYSDAAAIGEAARALADAAEPAGWENATTGSSGTVTALPEATARGEAGCRVFDATVRSLRGVHRYAATACRESSGGLILRSVEDGESAG